MARQLKPGINAHRKIKYNARKLTILLVGAIWIVATLSCSTEGIVPLTPSPTDLISEVETAYPENPGTQELTPQVDNTPEEGQTLTTTESEPSQTSTPEEVGTPKPPILYYTQAGDTLLAVAVHFGVKSSEITSAQPAPATGLIQPGSLLIIPDRLKDLGPAGTVLPDSEVVFSPSAVDFDVKKFAKEAGGYLNNFSQYLDNGWYSGPQVVERVAIENSVNPRLLLALLEFNSHWVYGKPSNLAETDYPMGFNDFNHSGLYRQLSWAVSQLSLGYYGWRAGLVTELVFPDQSRKRLGPELNAGTVAIQYLFSKIYSQERFAGTLYGSEGFEGLYDRMYGNPWLRAETVEPLYPQNLTQPVLELPFIPGHTWSLTGGPHSAWGPDGALAALDFAPMSEQSGCVISNEWIVASASGLVVRSANGVLMLDLDGDGYEQTGWDILYLHVASRDRPPVGTWVNTNDRIGHPSCEGGEATGTHFHVARKFNGEWILADGPMPFVMSGWQAHAGSAPYIGSLTKGNQTVTACTCGSYETLITRSSSNPQ
jgi:LasA protease